MMRHAYCIIAHTEPMVLQALVDCIDDSRNDIFILVDKKSLCCEVRQVRAKVSRLKYIDEIPIYWGDVSQVRAEMALFRAAFSAGEYSCFHLLSGVDMPLMSQDAIHEFCDVYHPGVNFISIDGGDSDHRAYDRIAYYYLFTKCNNFSESSFCGAKRVLKDGLVSLQKKMSFSRLGDLRPRLGSNWASLSRDFVKYLLGREKLISHRYRMTSCPDEVYKQTELWNSPFRDTIYSDVSSGLANLRAIDWTRGNPYVWQIEDFSALRRSGMMFARKITSVDVRLLKALKGIKR